MGLPDGSRFPLTDAAVPKVPRAWSRGLSFGCPMARRGLVWTEGSGLLLQDHSVTGSQASVHRRTSARDRA